MNPLELRYIPLTTLLRMPAAVEFEPANRRGLRTAIEAYRISRPAVFNRQTGRLLTSAGELQAAQDAGQDAYPVLIGDWPESAEAAAAVIFSGGIDGLLASRPTWDSLIPLLLSFEPETFENIHALGLDFEYYQALLDQIAGQPPGSPTPPRQTVKNEWDIPALNPDLQAAAVPAQVIKWGTISRQAQTPGALYHFYTDDSKFAGLIERPEQLPATGATAAIEINFSTRREMPRAMVLWRIYQKRYIARAWQRAGVRLFVDMNVEETFFDLNLLGVPPGWTAYANRAYSDDLDHLQKAYDLAARYAAGQPVLYLVYGGGRKAAELCHARGWHWLPEQADEVRGNGT